MTIASPRLVVRPKRFVYVLRSLGDRSRYYTGVTSRVRARLAAHNDGECLSTRRHRPWELDVVIALATKRERSGS